MLCVLIPGKTMLSLIFLSWFLTVEEQYVGFVYIFPLSSVMSMVWYANKIDLLDVSSWYGCF